MPSSLESVDVPRVMSSDVAHLRKVYVISGLLFQSSVCDILFLR